MTVFQEVPLAATLLAVSRPGTAQNLQMSGNADLPLETPSMIARSPIQTFAQGSRNTIEVCFDAVQPLQSSDV